MLNSEDKMINMQTPALKASHFYLGGRKLAVNTLVGK